MEEDNQEIGEAEATAGSGINSYVRPLRIYCSIDI